jgi:hypothetical protein
MNLRKKRLSPGTRIKIIKGLTKERDAEIDFFDRTAKKWKVNFDLEWCGWYTRDEFIVIEE